MELHQLRYVVAAAREGSFTKAAASLYLAQPSLSVQIRKLESELGVRLFERLERRVALTAAGEAFLEHAERVLYEINQARARVEEVKGLRRGRIGLGVLPSVGARLVPGVLAAFIRRYPGVEVAMLEQDDSTVFERMVHEGELDLAVIRMPRSRQDLIGQTLLREPLVALVPPGHRLSDCRAASLYDLADDDFVAMKQGSGLRDLMEKVCAQAGFAPRVMVETGQLSIVWGMVRAGMGVAVLPRLAAGTESPLITIDDPFAARELGVVWRADQRLSPPAEGFLKLLLRSATPHSTG